MREGVEWYDARKEDGEEGEREEGQGEGAGEIDFELCRSIQLILQVWWLRNSVPVADRGSGASKFTISRGETNRGTACRKSQHVVLSA